MLLRCFKGFQKSFNIPDQLFPGPAGSAATLTGDKRQILPHQNMTQAKGCGNAGGRDIAVFSRKTLQMLQIDGQPSA